VWNLKINVISVIIGATGIISESFRKHLSNNLGKQDIRNYGKQPNWALRKYFGKYLRKIRKGLSWDTTIYSHVP
jgi:hypothetical protein